MARSIGRNAGTGRFTPISTAKQKPSTHVVEKLPPPSKGSGKK
jgi:hypothetical protein